MAEDEAEDQKKKSGLLRVGMFVLSGVGLIMAGFGSGYFIFGTNQPDPSDEIEEIIEKKLAEAEADRAAEIAQIAPVIEKAVKEKPAIENFVTTYFEFPGTFTTNLKESRKFLQVGLGVSTQYDETVIMNVESHQLALRSEILNVMSEFTEADIAGKTGREALARSIAASVNEKLIVLENFGGVQDIHFTSFVLQ